jgi:hypothetical protein
MKLLQIKLPVSNIVAGFFVADIKQLFFFIFEFKNYIYMYIKLADTTDRIEDV